MRAFEVALYNQVVREKVNQGERHREYTDDWADMHYITIKAIDADDARDRALSKYPAAKGFVIEDVSESLD